MTSLSSVLLQSNPFETLPRVDRVDWIALSLLLSGLILLMVLQYRNPSAIGSMLARSFRGTSKKLYFAAPAIDSVDKLLFSFIYVVSGALCVHLIAVGFIDTWVQYLVFLAPVLLLVFILFPMRITGFLVGYEKPVAKILKRQLPLIYLTGVLFLILGVVFFLKNDLVNIWSWTFFVSLVIFLLWMHIRVIQDLILEQISIFYIFMYFCTLEILPLFIFGVWISRN